MTNQEGFTPLMQATSRGNSEVVSRLVAVTDITIRDRFQRRAQDISQELQVNKKRIVEFENTKQIFHLPSEVDSIQVSEVEN